MDKKELSSVVDMALKPENDQQVTKKLSQYVATKVEMMMKAAHNEQRSRVAESVTGSGSIAGGRSRMNLHEEDSEPTTRVKFKQAFAQATDKDFDMFVDKGFVPSFVSDEFEAAHPEEELTFVPGEAFGNWLNSLVDGLGTEILAMFDASEYGI